MRDRIRRLLLAQLSTAAMFLIVSSVCGQQTQPTPDDDVVKISTELVQIDAVVTDKNGVPVTDLTANDFELLQDGKPQTISNLSYVSRTAQTINTEKADKAAPLPPPVSSKAAEFGRVITFIVDDGNCDSTHLGMSAAQKGLEKFVKEQMQPNDLVAIYQTRQGSKLVQQYTSDKTRLLSVIQKIRWVLPNLGCVTYGFDETQQQAMEEQQRNSLQGKNNPSSLQPLGSFGASPNAGYSDNAANLSQTVGAIGVLRYVVNGLRRVGGRKLVFYLSDSFRIDNGRGEVFQSYNAVRDLTALANRASIVINTIDVRGLEAPGGGGGISEPTTTETAFKQGSDGLSRRTTRQGGMQYIANETGGKFYTNQNFLDNPIRQSLKSEIGYYLLAYQPDGEIFKGKKFHKIEVKLKRADLSVNSRSGFFGVTDKEMQPKPRSGDGELYESLVAPLPNADVSVRLSAYFVNDQNDGNIIRALLHVDGKDIKFGDDANGFKKAIFDVVAVTLDEKNNVIDEFNRTHTVRIPAENVKQIETNGLIYTADVPVKKEGTYNFRIALRESAEKRIGSSSQVIEVPDLKKGRLVVSGLVLSAVDAQGKTNLPGKTKAETAFAPVFSTDVPAVRKFRRGAILGYFYTLYNVKVGKENAQPNLSVQTNLYFNGNLLVSGSPQPAQLEKQADWSRINDFGYMKLNQNTRPGDYSLQVIIKDLQNNQLASQSIDFEVIE